MKKLLTLSFVLFPLIIALIGCEKSANQRNNEELAKTFIEAWSQHEIDELTDLFDDECLYEEVASGRSYSNKEDIAKYVESTLAGVPDSKFETITIIADDEKATVEWLWKGTNSVGWEFMNIPATNKSFEIRGVSVMLIENGKITRNSDYWDWNTFITEIGAK